ncbi:MAG TPA: adenosine deaminase [Solirubrobacteraceae bacterium]|nr:adenosine deaminase [Solirubrobacteraceae bacterium]
MIATAELHVHLEGTAPPELIGRIARRNGVELPAGMLAADGRFHYTNFLHFLDTYDLAASVIRTAEDYRDITYEYLASVAEDGGIYVELTASPDHAALVGLSDSEHYAGIAAGIDDARREHGIEARVLLSGVRNFGAEAVLRVARHAAQRPHPYVVGFALAGDERVAPGQFAEAFAIAADAGLGCTVHAGEWQGPESIREALQLPVTRLDHGVRAIEDPALVRELAERRITLNTCPTSNVVLGVFASYADHPLPHLRAAGVRVTLGSDDPPYFGATLGGEYEVCREHFGWDDQHLREVTVAALEAAFCEEPLRDALLARAHGHDAAAR